MATFNKRGYKAPKEKAEKVDETFIEDVNVDEKDSTTAKAFDTLDQSASKAEDFIAKNQKVILGGLLAVVVVVVGYFAYDKFIAEPNQQEAAEELFVAQQNFQKAVDGDVKADSLFNLVLNGSEGKFGVLKIAEQYSGTDAANQANFMAGIAYLNTGKYVEAIASLEKFNSKDVTLSILAKGAIGDAYAQQNKQKEALEFYVKAADASQTNDFTRPRYLMKAGKTALAMGNKAEALKYFTDIKENFDTAPEAQQVDALIGLAQ
jgi:predicted negative regulator of RcsB-dependent stress response